MERSRDWIDSAEGDLQHAKNDAESGFYNWACFSAQQSAEKAVKAVFQKMGAEAWGHSVADLLEELACFKFLWKLLDTLYVKRKTHQGSPPQALTV